MEMDTLQEPLISNRDPDDREDVLDDDIQDLPSTSANASHHGDGSSPGLFMWLLTFSAGISGLLFGCMACSSSSSSSTTPIDARRC